MITALLCCVCGIADKRARLCAFLQSCQLIAFRLFFSCFRPHLPAALRPASGFCRGVPSYTSDARPGAADRSQDGAFGSSHHVWPGAGVSVLQRQDPVPVFFLPVTGGVRQSVPRSEAPVQPAYVCCFLQDAGRTAFPDNQEIQIP